MRIRKNAKLSSLQLLSGGSSSHVSGVDEGGGQLLLQPHVCQLNQSPWDAPVLALPLLQYQWEDSFTGTVNSLNDSAPAQDSFPVELEPSWQKKEKLVVKGRKVIGAGMTRKRKPRKGGSLGNYDNATVVTGEGESAGNRRRKKKGATCNPYEFYYYTGFGPYWRRRGRNVEDGQNGNFGVTDNISYMTPCIAVNGDNGMDMMMEEDEDEDGESNGDGEKKRLRKRVKARSLKSLM